MGTKQLLLQEWRKNDEPDSHSSIRNALVSLEVARNTGQDFNIVKDNKSLHLFRFDRVPHCRSYRAFKADKLMDVRTLSNKASIVIGHPFWSSHNGIQTVSLPETLGAEAESGSDL